MISSWYKSHDLQTSYELTNTTKIWNYRTHLLLSELRDQIDLFSCSGGIWTQTTDVEGEVNGLMTYDRRVVRMDIEQWKNDVGALYEAAGKRGGSGNGSGNGTFYVVDRGVQIGMP